MERTPIPVACTLGAAAAERQLDEWAVLRRRALATRSLPAGVRVVLPASAESEVRDLARREAACCAFLSLTTEVVDGEVVLDITADDPDGRAVIELLVGSADVE